MGIPTLSLKGKVALVTGGRGGVGRAIALGFAEAGADVAVCDLNDESGELQAVANEIRKLGRRSLARKADVSKKGDVDSAIEAVVAELGSLDILVNNAGICQRVPLLELSEDQWQRDMDVNLKSHYLCSKAAAAHMIERRQGNIICLASQLAFRSFSDCGAYSVAKSGVVMLVRQLARDLGKHSIRVNGIAPASVKTGMTGVKWHDPEALRAYEAGVPLGYMSEPGDMVGPALFLASNASRYVTGQTILVDGGINA